MYEELERNTGTGMYDELQRDSGTGMYDLLVISQGEWWNGIHIRLKI